MSGTIARLSLLFALGASSAGCGSGSSGADDLCPPGYTDACNSDRTVGLPEEPFLCFDLQTDPANCGACGVNCTATQTCKAGKCGP